MLEQEITQYVEFPSNINSLSKIERFIDYVCEEHGFGAYSYGNIIITVTEAVNNAIIHGNQSTSNKKVRLTVKVKPSALEFMVQDEGAGFDENSIPDPTLPENIEKVSGRGIFLIKTLADEFAFEDEGRTVRLTFLKSNG